MSSGQQRFSFDSGDEPETADARARRLAVDPTRNVALEASAGTGKTRVLVERYLGLLLAGVKPRNILAITFTRKAAAEMRQRILDELARRHREGALAGEIWRDIRDRAGEIAISTIDAFCLALLREFPLEADVDPGFDLADETETPRLVEESLDRTLGRGRRLAIDDEDVALVFAALGEQRLRQGLARLLDRRIVAWEALNRFVQRADITPEQACARLSARLRAAFSTEPGGLAAFLRSGPAHPDFEMFASDVRMLVDEGAVAPHQTQVLLERVRDHLLTRKGEPRKKLDYRIDEFRSRADYDYHKAAVLALGPYVIEAIDGFKADLNLVLARGVRRLLAIALDEYRRTLQKENVLDFSDVLLRTLELLRRMDEFSRSRFRLESRYQHVLVDEFQDTSRAQWELVELLVRAWGEGEGLTESAIAPSIFIVGDRKQSIYGFRDAEVAVLEAAARYIDALRPIAGVRQAITRSFRSAPPLLAFVNDVFGLVEKQERPDGFRYDERDRFPIDEADLDRGASATPTASPAAGRFHDEPVLGLAAAATDEQQAEAVADEIARLILEETTVRDRETGVRRAATPGDIALLFRTRESHRVFEAALERRRVPFYVYKGLGFFDADEIKDVLALVAWLAAPESNLRAAALLRSRVVRLSDEALKWLAPGLADAIVGDAPQTALDRLAADDRTRLNLVRAAAPGWLALVDRLPPAELVDRVLAESAYPVETRGAGAAQARENLKKIRGLVRRIQNRGYATVTRLVDYFSQMVAGGDESNAIVDAVDAVNLMTVHAAKGLEFPVVFIVNLAKGSGGSRDAVRVALPAFGDDEHGLPEVAIGEHESAADRDEDAREAEETKRLMYVAMTRARDRLYLGTTLSKDRGFQPGRGSLGRVLPASLVDAIVRAGDEGADTLAWAGPSATHRWRRLVEAAEPRVLRPAVSGPAAIDRFGPLPAGRSTIRASVTSASVTPTPRLLGEAPGEAAAHESTPLVGTLVHRALAARVGFDGVFDAALTRSAMAALVGDEERASGADGETVARAAEVYGRLLARTDVRELISRGRLIHEIAFSRGLADGSIVRGIIDCLVIDADRVTVVEVKTGAPLEAHRAQLAAYVEAVRAVFPGSAVDGRLIYPGAEPGA